MARELLLIALLAACGHDKPAAPPGAGSPLAGKAFYRVDAAPLARCANGTTCEARLVLTALADYHVNKDYPFKFIGEPSPAIPVDGEGAFALDAAAQGTMTIKFRPTTAGTARLVGTFKLSVCSADRCEIETPRLELAIPVS